MSQITITSAAVNAICEQQGAMAVKLQQFNRLLNHEPKKNTIKARKGIEYIPISHLEMLLDTLYFGQWSVCNIHYERILNEITVSLDLRVFHPISQIPIIRSGVASSQIMQDKDTTLSEFQDRKKKNALETGFPKAKAQAFTNACKSLGKLFGRDLGRSSTARAYKGFNIQAVDELPQDADL